MCANVLIWGIQSGQRSGKTSSSRMGIALATYAHFNTRLTGTQCGGLCCATQRRDSHGGNFCLTGDILSEGMQGLVARHGPEFIPELKTWEFPS